MERAPSLDSHRVALMARAGKRAKRALVEVDSFREEQDMRSILRRSVTTAAVTVALLSGPGAAWCQVEGFLGHVREFEARETAIEAYIFGYPLVTMEITRRVMTNVAAPEGTRAPLGQFVRMRTYPNAAFKDVTAPNADTLYTTTWLDVSTEVFQVPGKRTTGTGPQTYAITGPGWSGTLPSGVTQYKSPTAMVWILGRIYCTGTPQDYAAVHALQDKFT